MARNQKPKTSTQRVFGRSVPGVLAALVAVSILSILLGACSSPAEQVSGPPSTPERNSAATVQGTSLTASTEVLAQQTGPRTVFVAPNGNDANTGFSVDAPVKSNTKALQLARPGDTVSFAKGTYEPLQIRSGGTAGAPLIVTGDASGGTVFRGFGYDPSGPNAAGVIVLDSEFVELRHFDATFSFAGIRVERSSNVLVEHVSIYDVGQPGFVVAKFASFVTLRDSSIRDTGNRPGNEHYGEGLYLGSGDDPASDGTHDLLIERVDISETMGEAIDIKPFTYNVIVRDNNIHDITHFNSGAVVVGIGSFAQSNPNVLIERNTIHGIESRNRRISEDGNAITLSASATVRNNVIWDVQDNGILVDKNFPADKSAYIYHNTVFQTGQEPIHTQTGPNQASPDIRNNFGSSLEGNLMASAQDFVNAAAGNFVLNPSSAAINAGDPTVDVSRDLSNQPRDAQPDIGAMEFVGQPSSTGSPTTAPTATTTSDTTPATSKDEAANTASTTLAAAADQTTATVASMRRPLSSSTTVTQVAAGPGTQPTTSTFTSTSAASGQGGATSSTEKNKVDSAARESTTGATAVLTGRAPAQLAFEETDAGFFDSSTTGIVAIAAVICAGLVAIATFTRRRASVL